MKMPIDRRRVPIFNTSPMVGRLILACVVIHIITVLLPLPVWYDFMDKFAFVSARYSTAGAWQLDLVAYLHYSSLDPGTAAPRYANNAPPIAIAEKGSRAVQRAGHSRRRPDGGQHVPTKSVGAVIQSLGCRMRGYDL